MFKNFWYVCDWSDKVTSSPQKVRIVGQNLVVYRKQDNSVVAMSDLCPHRGGSLSMAKKPEADGCLRCPYHGWKYNHEGECTEIPSNGKRKRPPRRARVDAYPTAERYGMVWVFLGDLPEEERPPLPVFPTWGRPNFRPLRGIFDWNANYERVIENGIDISHTAWVHQNSFGNPEQPEVEDYDVQMNPWGLQATTHIMGPEPSPLMRMFKPNAKSSPVQASVGVQMSCVSTLSLQMVNGFEMHLFDVNVPIDENRTRTFWITNRNFFKQRWADPTSRKKVLQVFLEDQPFVEAQTPDFVPDDLSAELHVASDRTQLAYRQLRQKAIGQGWQLDSPTAPVRKRATVIGGPARRREQSDRTWVFPETPTSMAPDAVDDLAAE